MARSTHHARLGSKRQTWAVLESNPPWELYLDGDWIKRSPAGTRPRKSRRAQPGRRPIQPRPPGLQPPDGNLPQPIPGQAAQVLGCLHLQHLLEMLLGLLDISQLQVGEGETVHGPRVRGIDLEGPAQIFDCIKLQ